MNAQTCLSFRPVPFRHRIDDVLVERIAVGDPAAFERLRARHAARLYRFALTRLGDVERAQRAVETVFEEVVGAWPPERGAVARWLNRMIWQACRVHE